MISAFDIYLVMQLDSIVVLLTVATICSGMAGLLFGMWGYLEDEGKAITTSKKVLAFMAIAGTLAAVTPSSKTAAAMIVIPAIVNNEKLQAEAGELYELAKTAMRNAVTDSKAELERTK